MEFKLTETSIRKMFETIGINEDYSIVFANEVKRMYHALEEEDPDYENTTYADSNLRASLESSRDYIICYSQEREKGHCVQWAESYAKEHANFGETESVSVRHALDSLCTKEEQEIELKIHAESINPDPIFMQRYMEIIKDGIGDITKQATEYAKTYHWCINNGKSHYYAHAYADVSNEFHDRFCKIHAEAYETAKLHGMSNNQADIFGETCTKACSLGYFHSIKGFVNCYGEDWQKDFYLHLICKEYKEMNKSDIPIWELEDIKKEVYQ